MTSVMDDVCGHACFVAGSGPWCGATVQVNCKLRKPVQIGSYMKVCAHVVRGELKKGKVKVQIQATLTAPDGQVHAELEGVSIDGVRLQSPKDRNDGVGERVWLPHGDCFRDSGYSVE